MASLKNPLVRKLKKVLAQEFPPPATIKLEDHDGIIGVITSAQLARMETTDRQSLIGEIVESHLNPAERRQVLAIVAVTPEEGTGYLAGED